VLPSVKARFQSLEPYITAYGPNDKVARPAVLLFHACNGVKDHIHAYARDIADLGFRAFVVDSFAARGWNEAFALSFVCTGLMLGGHERSGDVLAAIWGLGQREDVYPNKLMLAGWSHGGWAIMDLMTDPLAGHTNLESDEQKLMQGVKGVFLVYPYMNVTARSNSLPWLYRPRVKAVLALNDYLTPDAQARKVLASIEKQGIEVESLRLEASHCFDENEIQFLSLMAYNRQAHEATRAALKAFCLEVFDHAEFSHLRQA
jgi:dienelactone hydrolase